MAAAEDPPSEPGAGHGRPWHPPGLGNGPLLLSTGTGAIQEAAVAWLPSYRIIASEYAGENLFDRLTSAADYTALEQEIADLRAIADLTNSAIQHEAGRVDLVRPEDRVYGHGAGLIMAAFAYPRGGTRFSDGRSGAYYAARELDTAIAETVHHTQLHFRGIGPCTTEKTVVEADLDATLVDLRAGNPCPGGVHDPASYGAGQAMGAIVRRLDGYGIVYDSVRQRGGTCAAIFRPPVLSNARATQTLHYHWDGTGVVDVR